MARPKILFVDAYDSFSSNIIALVELALKDVDVCAIKIDDSRFIKGPDSLFHDFLQQFDAVIAGPGPGNPGRQQDVGLIGKLWEQSFDLQIPVLGICLGFQSLALAFGGKVQRLRNPRHGLVTPITHESESVYAGLDQVNVTQYHSLRIELGHASERAVSQDLHQPTSTCPDLQPLAWDFSDDDDGPILMTVKHTRLPYWGVQYHPESVCTDGSGAQIIKNWWKEARNWSLSHRSAGPARRLSKSTRRDPVMNAQAGVDSGYASLDSRSPSPPPMASICQPSKGLRRSSGEGCKVLWTSFDISENLQVTDIVNLLRQGSGLEPLLLESGTKYGSPVRSDTGRFSIIATPEQDSAIFRYWTQSHVLETTSPGETERASASIRDVFHRLRDHQSHHAAVDGPDQVPFWGGLIGYISYEAGLETIDVEPSPSTNDQPDVWFTEVRRSVVVDHIDSQVYVQSVHEDDQTWLMQMQQSILSLEQDWSHASAQREAQGGTIHSLNRPHRSVYCNKVEQCLEHIRAGSSYELCLTDQTTISLPSSPSPWSIYQRLRTSNPAPFGAYLSLTSPVPSDSSSNISILSSSPERFLSWSRTGKVQYRPIKGTVQKSSDMTPERATEILASKKERAENLMIVDLIRHDLHGVVGAGNVCVSKLMQVEEYETVYQLVSVIEGVLPGSKVDCQARRDRADEEDCAGRKGPADVRGIDVLASSLPPGSMTGAPKKRSCELLRGLEDGRRRGVYGGVLGYLDAGGGGDFSVVIRTLTSTGNDGEWKVGAGGAVTALSTPEGEWEEMMGKSRAAQRF